MAALEHVGIVGLGVIGGSLAQALRAAGIDVRGWSASSDDCFAAAAAGVATATTLDGLSGSDIIVIAVPLADIAAVARGMLARVRAGAMIFHAGGLQRPDAIGLGEQELARVIGTHPIAGSHSSGFAAARAELFRDATVSVEARATDHERAVVDRVWRAAGAARIEYRDAEVHDRLMVWVSHLPQLAATALAAAIDESGTAPRDAGSGARDTTRLAQSRWPMWRELLAAAPDDLPRALAALEAQLRSARIALERGDASSLGDAWEQARSWRSRAGDAS